MKRNLISPAWGAVAVFVALGVTFIWQSTTDIGGVGHIIMSIAFFASAIFMSIMLANDIKEDKKHE